MATGEDLSTGTSGTAGGAMGALLGETGGVGGLVDFQARPAGRYPRGGRGASVGGTCSGRSRAGNLVGFEWLIWTVRSSPSSSYVT